ncbi:hypothetical protein SMQC19_12680 [Serratia marcescens]|nr:hypothetical protein [Serratia marcescens]BEO17921.1 hypothetical protein SMQC19_12680 [Serratia marcescens]
MHYILNYFSKDELSAASTLLSAFGILINLLVLIVAYKALASWRNELKYNDKNQVITFLFDDVKNLHSDFISVIVLQSKYLKKMSDADNDPVEHLRNDERFNNPEIIARIESNELVRMQRELKIATEEYLQAHERYAIKIISLSSYIIPLQRYPLDKRVIDKISESINNLSTSSYSCLEYFDNTKDITEELYLNEVNQVNAMYIELLVDIDTSKVKILGK